MIGKVSIIKLGGGGQFPTHCQYLHANFSNHHGLQAFYLINLYAFYLIDWEGKNHFDYHHTCLQNHETL